MAELGRILIADDEEVFFDHKIRNRLEFLQGIEGADWI